VQKVLIIEDDADTLEFVSEILGHLKLRIISSYTLLNIEQVASIKPQVILLDHWVGKGRGSELCEALKKDARTKNIRIIMFSGDPDIGRIAAGSRADGFVQKPFDVDRVLELFESTQLKKISAN